MIRRAFLELAVLTAAVAAFVFAGYAMGSLFVETVRC